MADVEANSRRTVKDGTIDVIATDPAPHHYDEKEREFSDAPNGIIGFETALAVNITWLVKPEIISLATLIDKMSCAPARLFHLPGGSLRRGAAADVTVFDPTREWTVDPATFRTKGRNTPYGGRTLTGWVSCTMVDGRIVHTVKGRVPGRLGAAEARRAIVRKSAGAALGAEVLWQGRTGMCPSRLARTRFS